MTPAYHYGFYCKTYLSLCAIIEIDASRGHCEKPYTHSKKDTMPFQRGTMSFSLSNTVL